MTDFQQIQISASSRGIVDYFLCFVCDEYKWDCDHLIEERLTVPRVAALQDSKLQTLRDALNIAEGVTNLHGRPNGCNNCTVSIKISSETERDRKALREAAQASCEKQKERTRESS
jgi:hypothetical protein